MALTRISEELKRIQSFADRQQIFEMAPAYLFTIKKEEQLFLTDSMEMLIRELEEQRLLSELTADWLWLTLEYGVSERNGQEMLGLADKRGKFRQTLDEWLSFLRIQYQIEQGIVLIHLIRWQEYFSEQIWCNRFFRQMKQYKSNFLFLFYGGQNDMNRIEQWLGEECFCRKIEIQQPELLDYAECFKQALDKNGLHLDKQGETALVRLLGQYKESINSDVLKKWQQEIVWDLLCEEQCGEEPDGIFPAACLKEDILKKYLSYRQNPVNIGFEVIGQKKLSVDCNENTKENKND